MDADVAGPSHTKVMTRKSLFMMIQQRNLPNINEKLDSIEKFLMSNENYSEEQLKEIKHKYSHFKCEMKRRWTLARNREELFLSKNSTWLEGTLSIPRGTGRTSSGRPFKSFCESSERTKRRKTKELRSSTSLAVLIHATQIKLRSCGKRDASDVLKDITSSPTRASKYKKALSGTKVKTKMTLLRALAMFVEADLSRRQYEIIRSSQKNIYPCYSIIQSEKRKCYPRQESYRVTETCAEVTLQGLMDHTATRLLCYLEEVLQAFSDEQSNSLILMCKWGCDGSQQAQYKQKFENMGDSDANIFLTSFVPLKLICAVNNRTVWQNPIPSSPRYCRRMRIRFVKESADIINEEISYIKNAINSLRDTKVTLTNTSYSIKHILMLTMVDGKVCNAATQTTSTMKCYICGKTSKDFNDLKTQKQVKPEAISFGLSILHARIRLFESILHLAYKLPIKKWQLRSPVDKVTVKERKTKIQADFRSKLGLIVDVPKPGFGSSNDGNTSRRFFENPELAAEITGIDIKLINRLKIILEAISCGHKINIKKFQEFALETAHLYVKLYEWHPMTPTLHKILVHGASIIEQALLPIGMLSEEAAEARNKHFRLYRTQFARKFSRSDCNLDVLNRLLLTSDPLITGLRPVPRKTTKPFLQETISLLLPGWKPDSQVSSGDEGTSDEPIDSDEEPWQSSSSG